MKHILVGMKSCVKTGFLGAVATAVVVTQPPRMTYKNIAEMRPQGTYYSDKKMLPTKKGSLCLQGRSCVGCLLCKKGEGVASSLYGVAMTTPSRLWNGTKANNDVNNSK